MVNELIFSWIFYTQDSWAVHVNIRLLVIFMCQWAQSNARSTVPKMYQNVTFFESYHKFHKFFLFPEDVCNKIIIVCDECIYKNGVCDAFRLEL